jgi:SAM-dependent methyltransferase
MLNQMQLRVISMDVSRTALDVGKGMRERYPPVGDVPEHLFMPYDGDRFDLPDRSVDRIVCIDALHHVPNQDSVLSEMGRVLKEGGIAGFSEPGPNHSKTSEAQFEMRSWKVIENDIVLEQIFENSRKYGFTDLKVSVATIHPPLVSLHHLESYFANPASLTDPVRDRTMNYPIFFLYKGDPEIRDSRAPDGLSAMITPSRRALECLASEPVKFSIDVTNTSAKTWLASGPQTGCVNVGGVLRSRSRSDVAGGKEYRFSLSAVDVEPNSAIHNIEVNLGLLEIGEYSLDLDLVSENVCWFQSRSGSMVKIDVVVRSD